MAAILVTGGAGGLGTAIAARAALPSMIAARSGSIVAFSSGYAHKGYRNGASYAAAKAGIEALITSIALENAAFGIRANSIAPYVTGQTIHVNGGFTMP